MLVSVPIGIATAVYVTEVKGRFRNYVRFFIQAESGVPSVVAGLFILTILILTGIISQSALAGALAYSILMLPTVARTSEEVLKLIPDDLRTGALALGSTRARTVLKVVSACGADGHHHRDHLGYRSSHGRDSTPASHRPDERQDCVESHR
jgi:phosphate transport system permease protein